MLCVYDILFLHVDVARCACTYKQWRIKGDDRAAAAWSPKVFCRAQLSYDRARFSYRPRRSVCLSHAGNDSKLMTIGSRGSPDFSLLTANFVRASVENGGGGKTAKMQIFDQQIVLRNERK